VGRERALRAVDEANLVLDHPGQVNVFLVAGLLAPGGFVHEDRGLDLEALRAVLERRVADLPALRQVPVPVGRTHEWADQLPDLRSHVRRVSAIDGLEDLERRCGDLMVEPLSRSKPMWELLIAPTGEGAAIILRIHHALADGVTAAGLIRRLLDHDTASAPAGARLTTHTRPASPSPSTGSRLGHALYGLRRTVETLTARGLPETVLLGERSSRHGVIFADADLRRVAAAAHRIPATVNDAVLAVAAAGYRAALVQSGEHMPADVPVSVPVALERTGDSRNQVGVMLVHLPMDASSSQDAVTRIAAQTRTAKVEARRHGTLELMRGPVGARIMNRIAQRQHFVAGFVTNVPGPDHALRLAGAPLLQLWPVAVLAANVRLGVAASSYAGRLCLGVHFDAEYIDGGAVGAAIRRELAAVAG
jgi:diacylglycerol O-acyltransferase